MVVLWLGLHIFDFVTDAHIFPNVHILHIFCSATEWEMAILVPPFW